MTSVRVDIAPPGPATESVEQFYAATYPRLVGLLTVASGSRADAEEVVQEAFVRLIPRWGTVSRYDDPEAWVRLVAFRISHSRRQRARSASRAVTRLGPAPDVEPPDAARVDAGRVLAALPREHREVLVLHHALGLPVDRIAKELGVPVGTVKSRLARARAAAAAQGGFGDD